MEFITRVFSLGFDLIEFSLFLTYQMYILFSVITFPEFVNTKLNMRIFMDWPEIIKSILILGISSLSLSSANQQTNSSPKC